MADDLKLSPAMQTQRIRWLVAAVLAINVGISLIIGTVLRVFGAG